MRKAFCLGLFAVAALVVVAEEPRGTLVAVGGGATPDGLHRRMIELGGGTDVNVLVIPQASEAKDAGDPSVKAFREAGATRVSILTTNDTQAALDSVRSARVIWMPGGDQSHLMQALKRLGVVEAIRQRYHQGAVVGGTSAGAAVISKVMITGNPKSKEAGAVPPISDGLGLWPEVIVDQHFVKRSREPRLRAAVHAHPDLVGVGIDEATGVILRGSEFEVFGQSTVTVVQETAKGGQELTILHAGKRFDAGPKK